MTELPQANWKKKTKLRWSKRAKRPKSKPKNSDEKNAGIRNHGSYSNF